MIILFFFFFLLLFVSVLNPLSAKGREEHGLDFAKTILGYDDWENLRDWNKTLSAKDSLLFTIQVKDIITSSAAIAIDYSATANSQSNDFFILEQYFQMIQFSKNKTSIPSIDEMPSLGFGIMHRNFCHSGFFVDKSSAEDSLKSRLLESSSKIKFGIGKKRSLLSKRRRQKKILNSPGRWKIGRTKILIPSVANAFSLNLKKRKHRELATFISAIIYYTHLLGDYIVGTQVPLPEYRDAIIGFKKDLKKIHTISIKDKMRIKSFFNNCKFDKTPEENAQNTINEMAFIFPNIILNELHSRNHKTYSKLKENKKLAFKEMINKKSS